jgi:hypothetical protein
LLQIAFRAVCGACFGSAVNLAGTTTGGVVFGWNTDSCECAVTPVTLSIWWRSVASAADSALAVVPGVWPKVLHCWLMKFCPMSQWVLSFPFQPCFLFASCPHIMGRVLGIVYRVGAEKIAGDGFNSRRLAPVGVKGIAVRLSHHYFKAHNKYSVYSTCYTQE